MNKYIIMIRGGYETFNNMTPEETQQSLQRYRDWTESIASQGKVVAIDKLTEDGVRTLNLRNGEVVLDGPYPETKETIGGILTIEAADYEEAVELARGCPIFSDGGNIELRQVTTCECGDDL